MHVKRSRVPVPGLPVRWSWMRNRTIPRTIDYQSLSSSTFSPGSGRSSNNVQASSVRFCPVLSGTEKQNWARVLRGLNHLVASVEPRRSTIIAGDSRKNMCRVPRGGSWFC